MSRADLRAEPGRARADRRAAGARRRRARGADAALGARRGALPPLRRAARRRPRARSRSWPSASATRAHRLKSRHDDCSASTERPDLAPILGELDEGAADKLLDDLRRADAKLASTTDELNARGGADFATEGSRAGERDLRADDGQGLLVENAKGSVGFSAELRPRNFYGDEQNPWQPGRPPMRMATDAWDLLRALSKRLQDARRNEAVHDPGAGLRDRRSALRDAESASRRSSRPARSWSSSPLGAQPDGCRVEAGDPEEVGGPSPSRRLARTGAHRRRRGRRRRVDSRSARERASAPGTSSAPSEASAAPRPPAAPEPGSSAYGARSARRRNRSSSSATCSGVAPFCGPNRRGAS